MRRAVLLVLAALLALPAVAARRVTVAQLADTLSSALAQHRSDEDIARQIGTLELSDRLTAATLDRFAKRFPLQPRTALALQLLADQSAFLEPPADELPATAAPDVQTQRRLLDSARAHAVETWDRLPNFFVTRVTTRFDDGPQVMHTGEWPVRAGLHAVGSSSRRITFRDGKEVLDQPDAKPGARGSTEVGLHSWGEFGPALTVVLSDMAHRDPVFLHWEQVGGSLAAVFRYRVPREASHYVVTFCCTQHGNVVGRTEFGYGGRSRSTQQVANIPREQEAQTFVETPGYQGTIAVDPVTGAVLRLTIDAELRGDAPILRAATVIEYGPVQIGDRPFICPLRSVAFSLEQNGRGDKSAAVDANGPGNPEWQGLSPRPQSTPLALINETRFIDYHRWGSTARILSGNAQAEEQNPTPSPMGDETISSQPPSPQADAGKDAPTPESSSLEPSSPAPGPAEKTQSADALPPPPVTTAVPGAAEAVVPEISMTAAGALPDSPLAASNPDPGFSIKVTTRLVDVGVVAYDKKGRAVTDLKADDFEIYDNGHRQEMRFFTPAPGNATAPSIDTSETAAARSFSNRAPAAEPQGGPAPETGATILLIDESHIAWPDMTNARAQMLKFVQALSPGERVGLYSMTGLDFRVLVEPTRDHAALAARLEAFLPTAQSINNAQEEEKRNRQQIEEVHNAADLNSVNGNHADVPDSAATVDPQLRSMGSDPTRASLIILAHVARHLASMAGHKNLVWVSSDNVFADWQDQQVGIDKGPKGFQAFAVRLQEAMNDAHTSVYPFDVSQLETGAIGADIRHRNVVLDQAAADNAATAAAAVGASSPATASNMQPGRITAQMNQDLHPIQASVREIAETTGGRAIRRSSDLNTALRGILDDGRAIYQLSFSPPGPADDRYHTIQVKLRSRHGLTLHYRAGFLFAKEPTTLKERFQQAVWRPLDVSEIAVAAQVDPSGGGSSVKVTIAARDLALEQQADRWMDKLEIFFIQRDDAGLHAQVEGETLGLRLKSATYQNLLPGGVPFERAVQLHPGMASLRVLVVDENSGRMGSVTLPAAAMRAGP